MKRLIKAFGDGRSLKYDKGNFDDWCVYLTEPDKNARALRDADYFLWLKGFADQYGADRVYRDFTRVYDLTGKSRDGAAPAEITEISRRYGPAASRMDLTLTALYATMIAEENKKHTKLGKRIKRLGVHMLLRENHSLDRAVNSTRGMGWRDIDALCRERGF